MKIRLMLLIVAAVFLVVGCKSEEEKKAERCTSIQEEINKLGGLKVTFEQLPPDLQKKITANDDCLFVGGNKGFNPIPQVKTQ